MDEQQLNPEEQQALNYLLEGEFSYFGLVSTRHTLPAPVHRWTYQRTHGRSQRTVGCYASGGVPHGNDAAIMLTLVHLYAQRPVELKHRPLEVTEETFRQRLALLFPAVKLTDDQLIQALHRLVDAAFEVVYVVREDHDTRVTSRQHFALVSFLIPAMVQDSVPDRLEAIIFTVSEPALELYLTGSFREL